MRTSLVAGGCAWIVGMALLGCDPFAETSDAVEFDKCESSAGNVSVAGTWDLSGNGTRSGCSDDHLDTDDMDLRIPALELTQTPGAAGQPDSLGFVPPASLPDKVTVALSNTRVRGSCVSFTLEEKNTREDVSLTRYVFTDATLSDDGSLTGDFTFTGPASCSGSGQFTATKVQ